ncbi:hypothetical protein OIU84_020458 [Salix udensis]|uniref:Uncharacterized protein n=1 Tax=Salix udensis TaxID=889485 RepID=A0AAD6PHT0_9ROSI|nr:hypothetical protein OIU84_020458 [Salix udensis]
MCSQMLFFGLSLRPGRRLPSGKQKHVLNPPSLQKLWLLQNVWYASVYFVKVCFIR